eukprot:scaffold62_cov256-Pinguiococcus_pyrenoidosus.AAC.5
MHNHDSRATEQPPRDEAASPASYPQSATRSPPAWSRLLDSPSTKRTTQAHPPSPHPRAAGKSSRICR